MLNKIKQIAEVIETKTRDSGESFYTIDYNKLSYGKELQDAVLEAHFDSLPDDYTYGVVCDFITALANDYDEISEKTVTEFSDNYTDIYNHDLLKWVLNNSEWVDRYTDEYGANFDNFINLLSASQNYQINSICQIIYNFLND
jgi:hypothetical protein